MLTVTQSDITLGQGARNKEQAIAMVAEKMVAKGLVANGYGSGMQNRERQAATFLGSGVAIPHGTTDTRDQVLKTGVQVVQFPKGVLWGDDGQKAYIAVGIAAGSDEHLGILKQLTRLLSVANLEERLKNATTAAEIAGLFNGDRGHLVFDATLVDTAFPACPLVELKAATAGLLSCRNLVDTRFVARVVSDDPVYLADGLWLSSTTQGVNQSAIALITLNGTVEHNGLPVKGLVTVAAADESCTQVLDLLAALIHGQKLGRLLESDANAIVRMLTATPAEHTGTGNTRIFTIQNSHGLHTRPSAMLVHAIKAFKSNIFVANTTAGSKAVDGRVLSNVVGLGLKKGQQIAVTVDGPDAMEALDAIENAIASGLGESVA